MRRPIVLIGDAQRGMMLAAGLVLTVASSSCVPRPRMCTATSDCADKSACVAGRCQVEKVAVKPAVDSARRFVVRPVDIAYLKRGDGPSGGGVAPVFALGKDGGKLFLRFNAPMPPTGNVVEAYVVLRRSPIVDDDPTPVSLHATRIVETWSGRSISWALQPRIAESRLPSTTVEPAGPSIVRVDVRELVRQWPRRDAQDQGIAIVSEVETGTGMSFALSGVGAEKASVDARGGTAAAGVAPNVEPYLELYVR